jgi:hypothetical protein
MIETLAALSADVVRELAIAQHVCIRPVMRRVLDRATNTDTSVAIPCGSTREAVCPSCAHKARVLRMQQCAEGWHLTHEPDQPAGSDSYLSSDDPDHDDQDDDDQDLDDQNDWDDDLHDDHGSKRVRSTRRRQDIPDLPQLPISDRTVGQVFTTPSGKQYRPSMFLTVTLPSYGPVLGSGAPRNPASYDYRRAALDALHFSKLCGRLWSNLRRCAGYNVQYFSAIEAQRRLAPHLHAANRGAIPRAILRQVVNATYYTLWWPSFDRPVYVDRIPVWDGSDYIDADTGEVLPSWDQALDALDADPDARPAHVLRFGSQLDIQGVIPEQADRAVRYLTKYLTKAIAETYTNPDDRDDAYQAHIDRLHAELRFLPCSPRCANWLRYGIQPDHPGPGLVPGRCRGKAHDRENLGLGGRRVLSSRKWSGKTIADHKADRAEVVRQTLLSAGVTAPEIERMAASVTLSDGSPRFVWTDSRPERDSYVRVILQSITERLRWRAQYEAAKTTAAAGTVVVDSVSTMGQPP